LARFFSTMFFTRIALSCLATLAGLAPALAQDSNPFAQTPDNLRFYTQCMAQARSDPMRALPIAEKWLGQGGGLGARHCEAISMFEAGRQAEAAVRLEAIVHDMGQARPGLRAELWVQAGQAWSGAGQLEKAAAAQSEALALKTDDPDLWVDRGLSYATLRQWPRAISDFDRALALRSNDVEILVLRSAAWRNAGEPLRARGDAQLALKIAPDNTDALLEHGFSSLALNDRTTAQADFAKVLSLVPPGTNAARRAEAGLQGQRPSLPLPSANDRAPASQDKR
jgi:tetratricopeptide (TPR) repeat protein